jgi:hypothetical protein
MTTWMKVLKASEELDISASRCSVFFKELIRDTDMLVSVEGYA